MWFSSVLLLIGTSVQMILALSSFRGTKVGLDFAVIDDWKEESRNIRLWKLKERKAHRQALGALKAEESDAFRNYRRVMAHLVGWVMMFSGAAIAVVGTVPFLRS